jgi:tetratricopeptide (TPR) repeat protein
LARERLQMVVALNPMNKEYAYDLARLESELNSPKGVIEILEKPFIKNGLDAEMSFMLLDAYFKTGQKARAALWAPTLLQKFPTESRSSLPLGILFYETKNKAKAKEILEAFTQRQGSVEGSYYLGKIHHEERNWLKAIDALNQAGDFHPEIPILLGDAFIKSNQPEKAIGVYESLYSKTKDNAILTDLYSLYKKTNNKPGTIQTLERILKIQPTNLDYRVELAELYRQKGDTKLAETQFEQILKSAPTHPGANLFMGMALAERREYGRAVKMLEIGTARYPDSLRAWKLIALAYRSQKNGAQSLKAYKRVLKDEPKNMDAAVAKMELTEELSLRSELPEAYSHVVGLDSNNFKAASSLAGIRYEEKRFQDASALYSRVMDKLGNDKQAWANYGISLLEIKNVSKAKSVLQRAFELGAKDMKILTSLARIYKEEGNVEKAENLLSEMVKKDPRNHMAWYELGRIAADRNQNGVAESNFKKALQLAPATSDYSEALAQIYFDKEDYSAVMQYLTPVRSKLSASGRSLYAESLMKQGKTDAALAEYNSVYSEQKSAPVLAKIAEIKVARGEYRDALQLIETSGFSSDSSVQLSLARAYVAQGEGDKARSVLNNLIRNSKYNAALYHLRGMSYYSENNCKKATKDFDQALKYNPDYMEAVYYTGVCLLKERRDQDAQNYFKELSQHNAPQWMAKGFMGMGLVFEGQKKIEAAENYLQKATTAYDDAEAYSHLSRVYMKRRKLADAERTARKALTIKQDEPLALGTLGEILVAQNRKNEALALTKKALADHPHSCPLLVSSVKINYSSGNYDTARQSGLYAITECPDEYLPYLYIGLVADKKYNKKEAKENFKKFLKAGGDENLIPSEYR